MDGWIHLHFSSPSFYFSFFILLPSLSFIHFLISFFYSHRSLPLYFLLSFFDCLPPLFIPLPSLLPNLLTIFLISYTSSFVSPTLFSFPLFFLVSSPHLLISFFASSFLSWPHLAPSSNPFLPVLSSLLSILFKSKMFVKLKPHLSSFFFFLQIQVTGIRRRFTSCGEELFLSRDKSWGWWWIHVRWSFIKIQQCKGLKVYSNYKLWGGGAKYVCRCRLLRSTWIKCLFHRLNKSASRVACRCSSWHEPQRRVIPSEDQSEKPTWSLLGFIRGNHQPLIVF